MKKNLASIAGFNILVWAFPRLVRKRRDEVGPYVPAFLSRQKRRDKKSSTAVPNAAEVFNFKTSFPILMFRQFAVVSKVLIFHRNNENLNWLHVAKKLF
jgi:hypothetical protein